MPNGTPALSAVNRATPALIRAASKVRGERVVHPRGVTFEGRLAVTGAASYGASLLDRPGQYDVLVRLSRAAGLPEPVPDVLGVAVRVLDCYGPGQHQDWLVDTTSSLPLLRHLPVPRLRPGGTYGSLLPYDVGGRRMLLGARWAGDDLALLVATPYGPWAEVGRVTIGEVVSGGRRVRFDPWTTGGGITPVGVVQHLRRGAYPASHVAADE